jgi:NIMA-interacting peptidyl-prolyl cis-trans isomerase 1
LSLLGRGIQAIQFIHSFSIQEEAIIMPEQVRTAHLLIKHTGSRNPVSRRTGAQISMSPEDAMKELQLYEAKIQQEGVANVFPKYALERSDCGSFKQQGDLGMFGRGDMQRPFEEASFALQIGEMSPIVSTDSGYHLIYRIA